VSVSPTPLRSSSETIRPGHCGSWLTSDERLIGFSWIFP
jgi:hypothetical protein